MNARQTKLSMKKVQFDNNVHTLLVPYDDRKGKWMNYANDRAHFRRRIQQPEMILLPILNKIIKFSKGKLVKQFDCY